jgi:hypothetical protein
MSYNDSSDYNSSKTLRIGLLSMTLIILGFFFLMFKAKTCEGRPESPETCKEEFQEVRSAGYSDIKCSVGATIEVINSPPSPKAGIMCRCLKPTTPASSSSN